MSTAPKTTSPPIERRRVRRRPRAGGFTLLELLTVLALISVLLGIGAGAFKRVRMGRALAVAQVKDALRAARVFAVEESAPARVEFDARESTLRTVGFVRVGNWHFEGDGSFGWPTRAEIVGGAEVVAEGALGSGVRLRADEPGSVLLGRSPSFDADQGLAAELFVRPAEGRTAGDLLRKGRAWSVALTEDLRVAVSVSLRTRGPDGGERLEALSERSLVPGRFARVGFSFDGRSLSVRVDGVLEAEQVLDDPSLLAPDPMAPLEIGGGPQPFAGVVDEVRLSQLVTRSSPPLPDDVVLGGSGAIWFDARGRLDPAHHRKPVSVVLVYDEGRRRRDVVVGLLGDVR